MTKSNKKNNIVFINVDQLNSFSLGCYGNKDVSTPNLDNFAKKNLLFEKAYTATPVCGPYRATCLTGRYPSQTGVTKNGLRLPPNEKTIADVLNNEGYHTSFIGKWHLSGPPQKNRWVPPEERGGFNDFIGWESHHVDHWEGKIFKDDPKNPIKMEGHETDYLTDIVCDKLEEIQNKNFCLFVSFQSPHPPCSPPKKYKKIYENTKLSYRDNVPEKKPWYKRKEWNADYDLDTFMRKYYGEISQLDASFGKIIDKIEKLELDKNTIIVFTSDHGEMMGSHGLYSKMVMYEEAIKVPLIIRSPSIEKKNFEFLFSGVDFFPTLLNMCNVQSVPQNEGVNYSPVLKGYEQNTRSSLYIEYGGENKISIIKNNIKLIQDKKDENKLFDLKKDPYEMNNLINNSKYDNIKKNMAQELASWRKDILMRKGDIKEAQKTSPAFK